MIALKKVSFKYADSNAGIYDVDLFIDAGECVVLTGCSGHGKSTLTRVINGLAPQYYPGEISGTIEVEGQVVTEMPLWQVGRTVGSVFQDPKSQFFSSELAGEVAFACENYGYKGKDLTERTDSAVKAFGLEQLCDRSIDLLSSGEKQRIAIASVYALRPKVYVCDEPTANLDEAGARSLAEAFARLKAEGHTLIIAEHRISWLSCLADRFINIKEGRIAWQRTPEEMAALSPLELSEWGLRSFFPVAKPQLKTPSGLGSAAVSTEELCCKRKRQCILQKVDFAAWPGQVVALTGRNGIGKTTFARTVSGLAPQSAGYIKVQGKDMSAAKRRTRIWYSDNDTGCQFFTDSVSEEMLLCSDRSGQTMDEACRLLKDLGLYSLKDAHPATLSGGQKQRLSLACGLLSKREILIFDEPTSGLDGRNLRLVSKMLRDLAEEKRCVLVITHDSELIQECCTHSFDFG